MDWLLALLLLWGSVTTAADEQAKADRLQAILIAEAEAERYGVQAEGAAILAAPWTLIPETTYLGDAVLVRSQTEGTLQWLEQAYPLLPFGSGYYTYLPVPTDMTPGRYPIGDQVLTVKSKTFEVQQLTVTEEQAQMQQNSERINQDQIKINKARSSSEPTFLFMEPFIQPIEGRLTTPYGHTRYVNGVFSGSHKAIDLAAPTGTPIKATNAGIVVLAEELYLAGNSIYIDHGMHLFSQYSHLSEISVQVGDEVQVGQTIGLVGTTGFSTGPHLHFTFWLHQVPANPHLFFGTTPFRWVYSTDND